MNGIATSTGKAIAVKRNAVKNLYEGQYIFTAWAVSLTAQDASGRALGDYNAITRYARDNDWTRSVYGFNSGVAIVAQNPYSFNLSVKDMSGTDVALITNQNIYGVVRQS